MTLWVSKSLTSFEGFFSDYFWLSMRGFLCVLIPVQSLTFFALRFFMWLFVWQKFEIFCKAYSDHLCVFWYQSKVWNILCSEFIRTFFGLPWVVSCLSSYRSKVWIFLWSGIIRNVFFFMWLFAWAKFWHFLCSGFILRSSRGMQPLHFSSNSSPRRTLDSTGNFKRSEKVPKNVSTK